MVYNQFYLNKSFMIPQPSAESNSCVQLLHSVLNFFWFYHENFSINKFINYFYLCSACSLFCNIKPQCPQASMIYFLKGSDEKMSYTASQHKVYEKIDEDSSKNQN